MENRKIKNAKKSVFNGIAFKSKLEETLYKTMVIEGLNPKYEPKKFVLMKGFKPTVPFYNRSKSRIFRQDNSKIRDITYTPDFIISYNNISFIIEAKGIENDTYPLKKKLFRKLLETLSTPCLYFEVHTKRELLEVIKIIKSYGTPPSHNKKTCKKSS